MCGIFWAEFQLRPWCCTVAAIARSKMVRKGDVEWRAALDEDGHYSFAVAL
jgi:hypothetical protein